jgi:hypothetical protein
MATWRFPGMSLHSLDDSYPRSRDELRRVAVHVLARVQHAASGRIGLRATPGGFGTSLYGADRERLRVSGGLLVHEIGVGTPTVTRSMDLNGSTWLWIWPTIHRTRANGG